MGVPQLDAALHDWARERLKHAALPYARFVEKVYLVEPGCICFTSKAPYSNTAHARTALLREGDRGPVVFKVVPNWDLVDARPEIARETPV